MRTFLLAIAVVMVAVMLDSTGSPSHARCELVGCTTECWWVGPGHRRCRDRCQRRCWNDAPRYYAPEPQQRYHAPESVFHGGPPFDPGAVVAIGLAALVIAAIFAAIAGASSDTTTREIAEIERNTFDAQAQAQDAGQKTHAITSYIASEEADAYQRGRRAADREWEDYTRDRS